MKEPILVSVGGGKGGVGKSTVTAYLGITLSRKGYTVGYVDADLGGANLHTILGVKHPRSGLRDFLSGKVRSLSETAVETSVPRSWLISGASDISELADPKFSQKVRLISHLKKMTADFVLVDLGAGTGRNVTDFYASFPYGIVVSDSLPVSVENAYGFLKNGILRGLTRLFPGNKDLFEFVMRLSDSKSKNGFASVGEMLSAASRVFPTECFHMREWLAAKRDFLVLNMVKDESDIAVGRRFVDLVGKYLTARLSYIGYISYAPEFRASVRASKPAALSSSQGLTDCFEAIASNLCALTKG